MCRFSFFECRLYSSRSMYRVYYYSFESSRLTSQANLHSQVTQCAFAESQHTLNEHMYTKSRTVAFSALERIQQMKHFRIKEFKVIVILYCDFWQRTEVPIKAPSAQTAKTACHTAFEGDGRSVLLSHAAACSRLAFTGKWATPRQTRIGEAGRPQTEN